ncbi:MAG: Crp/Fnr family transcriptional regulator [Acidovorax sp.]|nr:MAG: Crp/Fnr family transcriptional regulator [Acidovorax sp.]
MEQLAQGPLPEWQTFEAAATRRGLQAGEALFQAGDVLPRVFVVTQGLIKMVYETPAGDAWVKGFVPAGMCFASLTALEPGGVTSYAAVAEGGPCSVDQIDHGVLEALAGRHIEWQRALSNAYRLYGQRKEQREMELLTLSPQERYRRFLLTQGPVAAQLRQRDIASYVRVTPVALSRIKARMQRG